MDQNWQYAKAETKQILKIFKEFGIKKGKVLELCCGNGRICVHLAKKGFNVTRIDFSPDYIKDADAKAKEYKVKVHYVCDDIRRLNKIIEEKFDIILSIWTSIGFYTRKVDQKIIKMAANLLKKNGLFLILRIMSQE
ncbi:MAG: class I SAM-dependent methyltransferase [candidate division WOR-3 bacterium]